VYSLLPERQDLKWEIAIRGAVLIVA